MPPNNYALVVDDIYEQRDRDELIATLETVRPYVERCILGLYSPNMRIPVPPNDVAYIFAKPIMLYDRMKYVMNTFSFAPGDRIIFMTIGSKVVMPPPFEMNHAEGHQMVWDWGEYEGDYFNTGGTISTVETVRNYVATWSILKAHLKKIGKDKALLDDEFSMGLMEFIKSKVKSRTKHPFIRIDTDEPANYEETLKEAYEISQGMNSIIESLKALARSSGKLAEAIKHDIKLKNEMKKE